MKHCYFVLLLLGSLAWGQNQNLKELNYNEFLGYVKKYHPLVKNANLDGSSARTFASRVDAISSASSQLISSNSPDPRSPTRFSGERRRDGALTCMIPADPFAHKTPLLTG